MGDHVRWTFEVSGSRHGACVNALRIPLAKPKPSATICQRDTDRRELAMGLAMLVKPSVANGMNGVRD